MGLRIKQLCRERNMTMIEIASRIRTKDKDGNDTFGISPVTLSQSLNGNPTLARLQEVADILRVDVSELFDRPDREQVYGFLNVKGEVTEVRGIDDLKSVVASLEE